MGLIIDAGCPLTIVGSLGGQDTSWSAAGRPWVAIIGGSSRETSAADTSSAQNWPALDISELTMVSSKVDISFKEDVFRHKG